MPFRGLGSASPARKNRTRDRHPPAPAGVLSREARVAAAATRPARRLVAQYDVNNTYQYIVNREDTQLAWLAVAIADLGGARADEQTPSPEPRRQRTDAPSDVRGGRPGCAGVRRPLAAARRCDDERASPGHASRDPRRRPSSSSASSSRRSPAIRSCSAGEEKRRAHVSGKSCLSGGLNSQSGWVTPPLLWGRISAIDNPTSSSPAPAYRRFFRISASLSSNQPLHRAS